MGDLGTCSAPNRDHRNGALFDSAGNPRFCQIMSMHWDVSNRERVDCDGKPCPATPDQFMGKPITYNGHEVVAEVREFLQYSTHFFAECQAVNAYENTSPNPDWPFLDDAGRDGHFLTTPGTPPACLTGTCTNDNYECVADGCNGQPCCLPKPQTWQNLPGYEVAMQPASNTLKLLRPDVPYNQLDGAFGTTGGSEPAYNLSSYLGAMYKNDRLVTLPAVSPATPARASATATAMAWATAGIRSPAIRSGAAIPTVTAATIARLATSIWQTTAARPARAAAAARPPAIRPPRSCSEPSSSARCAGAAPGSGSVDDAGPARRPVDPADRARRVQVAPRRALLHPWPAAAAPRPGSATACGRASASAPRSRSPPRRDS
jgi:hypothetical protein